MTDFHPVISDKPLIVYVDIKSPYAFIAKDPTWALADELGLEFDWRPVTLDIPSYLGSATLDKRGKVEKSNRSEEQWGGVRYAYMDARRYAAAYGYALRGTEKIWDTRLIHIAFLWVKRAGMAELRTFIDAVFPPFWVRELDVEDEQVVLGCIEQAGVVSAGFLEWAAADGGAMHDEQQAAVFDAGIYGVPGYVLDGEYFFGREHLPLIRSRLLALRDATGAPASPVDIGNSLPSFTDVARNASVQGSKASVFLDMRRAAETGQLEIIAGINTDCVQSRLAGVELDRLQKQYPGKLHVRWGDVPCRIPKEVAPAALNDSRGDRHRANRARYQFDDLARYAEQFQGRSNPASPVCEARAAQLLLENGVSASFGYLYKDNNNVLHPFNGRQHLSALLWALS